MLKTLLSSLLLLTVTLPGFCQSEYAARLPVSGGFSELGVSPAEQIWIATRAGSLYFTPQVGQLWDYADVKAPNQEPFAIGETYERVTFFSENILMVSGFIQHEGESNFVYWSDNHGASWRKVIFGPSSWLDACYATSSGKAWMSGSSQLIYYTEDSGRSWRALHKVEASGNLRFSTIHFAPDERTGLFGSLGNVLYRTQDNCHTWEKLPTPLSQHKYWKVSPYQRPEILKARIFGDNYIVNQEGKVFLTRADHLDWQRLPNVVDFEVSESGQLYTIGKDLTVQLLNQDFRPVWQSTQRLDQFPSAISVRNEKLFAVTNDQVYRIDPPHFTAAPLLTSRGEIPEPNLTVRVKGTRYGFENQDVLRFDKGRKQWARWLTAPFPIASATVYQGQLLLSDGIRNAYFTLHEARKTIEPIELPALLFSDKPSAISEFHLEKGSQGCFHAANSRRSFRRKNSRFELMNTDKPSDFLSHMERSLPASRIEEMVQELDQSRNHEVHFSDLGITSSTLAQFNSLVEEEAVKIKKQGFPRLDPDNLYRFPGENTDFRFYQSRASTLATLPTSKLNEAFGQASGHWSTTRNWSRIIFVFEDGNRLIVENSDDQPNYLYTPWTGDYAGVQFRSTSIRFGELVDEVTKGQFFPKTVRDKKYALFRIVDYLYKQKLLAEQ